jgi:DNA topoisomerase IB
MLRWTTGGRRVADPSAATIAAISELYEDTERCAEAAGLVYVATDEPGIERLRHGRGFSYRQADGTRITSADVKQRIVELAIPPAWRNVWMCPSPDGHILATGEDDRGRKQYLDHPQWRALRARIELRDQRVASVVTQLREQRRRRLFTVDGKPIDAGEVNDLLFDLSGEHITAKDFRTWRGTRIAFNYLRAHRDDEPEAAVLAAVDLAADGLHNTRAVARAHYIHPHLPDAFTAGTFDSHLKSTRAGKRELLEPDERSLLGFLRVLLAREYDKS